VALVAIFFAAGPAVAVAAPGDSCTSYEITFGECPDIVADLGSDGVNLGGSVSSGNSGSSNAGGSGGSGGSGGVDIPNGTDADAGDEEEFYECENTLCRDTWGASTEEEIVTIEDLASFRVARGQAFMEPNGWAITGLHTNFYAVIGVHTRTGTLLEQPAVVRFTPTAYLWNYGDGSSARVDTPGASWASLGLDEFDATPSSHIYSDAGSYTASLAVEFIAEYQFADSDWIPVEGVLQVPSDDLTVTAGGAQTVLVDRECDRNRSQVGC